MKILRLNFISCLLVIFLGVNPSSANEDEWNALIDKTLARIDNAREAAGLEKGGEHRERVYTILKSHDRSKISIRLIEDDKERLSTDIYYSRGELFVNEHRKDWNIVTIGDYVYAWKNGESDGYKYKRNINDILTYIAYLTDPSFILSTLYKKYKSETETSTVSIDQATSISTAYFKEPIYGMIAIMFSEKPFWYQGWISRGQMSGKVTKILFGLPEQYDQVPSALFDKMKDIKFEERNYGLRGLLSYV